ncbi:MAG: preprotein translocase subunit SecE [Bdellovibrionota bacterium]
MAKEAAKKNIIAQGVDFSNESWAELKKVHAPSRQETIMLTLRVLMMVCLFGVFLGLTDLIVGKIMQSLLT